jgi:carboxypeptidase Q
MMVAISNRVRVGACLLIVTLLGPALRAEDDAVRRIIATGRADNQVMDDLDWLTNRIGPRLTSSDNLQDAVEWARDRFKQEGLENARLEEWGDFPVGFNRGPWQGREVAPTTQPVEFGTPAWSAGTKGVVRGHALLAPQNEAQLDAMRGKLAGAWVLEPDRGIAARGAELLAPTSRPNADFQKKLQAAYEQAPIAGIVRPTRTDLVVTSGNYRVSWDKLPTIPQINLVRKQFNDIVGQLRDGKDVQLEFDIRNHFEKGPIKLYNVIADIPGTEFPDEYVIVGGHIDSWDGATGATDNGTGCATTLEAARILMKAGVKPRRTIRFMLWSGEEQGLFGSKAYVKKHPELMPKISVVLVHDGGTNYLSGISGTAAMQADFEQVFAPVKDLDAAMPFAIRKVNGFSTQGASDHASFLAAGVPGIFWGQAGKANYNHTHHTQFDTYDAAIPDYQKHSSIVLAIGAYGIANLDHLLSREKLLLPRGAGRRLLGVQLDNLTIADLEDGGVAQKAGAKNGDIIVSISGNKITDGTEVRRAIQGGSPKIKMIVSREGKEMELNLDFGEAQSPESRPVRQGAGG